MINPAISAFTWFMGLFGHRYPDDENTSLAVGRLIEHFYRLMIERIEAGEEVHIHLLDQVTDLIKQ